MLLLGALLGAACAGDDPETMDVVQAIPWTAPERAEYELLEADRVEGVGVLTIQWDGDQIELSQEFSDGEGNSDTRTVMVSPSDLKPITMERIIVNKDDDARTEIRASYTDDAAAFESVTPSRTVNQTRDREPNSYDSEEHLFIGRTVPYAEDYEAHYRAIDAATTQTRVVSLHVRERETVEVPAGSFETWKVEFEHASSKTTAWYTVDSPHYLVRAEVGDFEYRLKALPERAVALGP